MARAEEERAFLEGIREEGGDAAPLAYADWLEEGAARQEDDDPDYARAQYIRLQVRLEDHAGMRARAAALFARHRDEWERPLRELGAVEVRYERGVPRHAMLQCKSDAGLLAAVFNQAPTLTSLRLLGCGPYRERLPALAASPLLARLTRLDFTRDSLCDGGVLVIAGSPHLGNLTHLNLSTNHVTAAGVEGLAASPHLANLTHLDLSHNPVGNEAALALVRSPHLGNLTHLNLQDCGVGLHVLAEVNRILGGRRREGRSPG